MGLSRRRAGSVPTVTGRLGAGIALLPAQARSPGCVTVPAACRDAGDRAAVARRPPPTHESEASYPRCVTRKNVVRRRSRPVGGKRVRSDAHLAAVRSGLHLYAGSHNVGDLNVVHSKSADIRGSVGEPAENDPIRLARPDAMSPYLGLQFQRIHNGARASIFRGCIASDGAMLSEHTAAPDRLQSGVRNDWSGLLAI
jgi:hypothetical protein